MQGRELSQIHAFLTKTAIFGHRLILNFLNPQRPPGSDLNFSSTYSESEGHDLSDETRFRHAGKLTAGILGSFYFVRFFKIFRK